MSKLVSNYTANGSSTTDEYGTFIVLNRFLQGDVVEGFAVVANSTPNMTVYVQTGSGRITTGTYPSSYGYLISHDTSSQGEAVTIATAAASPRIDYILAYIDKAVAGSTSGGNVNNTNNVLKFASVAGTPAGSPSVPTLSQIQTAIGAANPYVLLAQVAVAASVSTVTNPNITDLRVFMSSRNGLALGSTSYVDNGCVWSATSGLAAAMTAGLVYLNLSGVMVPVSLALISTRTFTASKDTYVSVNLSGTVAYAEVANNATSPALPANSVWLAIVVTGASAVSSVNQGDPNTTAPVVSGSPVAVSDTNGQLIYPQANQKLIGFRKITANFTSTTTPADVDVTGLSVPVIIPTTLRKIKATAYGAQAYTSGTGNYLSLKVKEDSTVLNTGTLRASSTQADERTVITTGYSMPSSGTHTYKMTIQQSAAGTMIVAGSSTAPSYVAVELD